MKHLVMETIIVGVFLAIFWYGTMTVSAGENKDIYKEYAKEVAESYDIAPEIVWSIIEQESSWNPNAYAKEGSKGLMQIFEKYHREEMELFDIDNLYEPLGNIDIGVYYLNKLIQENVDEYGEVEMSYILDLYNGNSKAKYNRDHGILSKYAKEVLDRAYKFEKENE